MVKHPHFFLQNVENSILIKFKHPKLMSQYYFCARFSCFMSVVYRLEENCDNFMYAIIMKTIKCEFSVNSLYIYDSYYNSPLSTEHFYTKYEYIYAYLL